MQRIDTVNARPNQNGTGKAGFSTNTDLAGQDPTYLSPEWCNAVQEEICGVIEGAEETLNPAIPNQLFLAIQKMIEADRNQQFDKRYPIGTGTIITLDPRNPAEYLERGTWVAWAGGTHLSFAGTSDGVTLVGGAVSGSHTHTITVDQLPAHSHEYAVGDNPGGGGVSEAAGATSVPNYETEETGGGQPIPIRPRTTTAYGWRRTA